MEKSVSRIVIETIVRKTLRDMKEAPERNLRNLIDRALMHSNGRFQKRFFSMTRRMLHNNASAYYALVRSLVEQVDHERILDFGVNLGYNSCTLGAKTIREIEAKEGFDIPWALFLHIDSKHFSAYRKDYETLIRQGAELGIYTWFVRADTVDSELCSLMADHPDHAFVLVCEPECMTTDAMETLAWLSNVMIAVMLRDATDAVCMRFREKKLLYCVCIPYDDGQLDAILNDTLLESTLPLSAPFAIFLPDSTCTEAAQQAVYDYVVKTRESQQFPTIALELFKDSLSIDTIISGDGCSCGFQANGAFFCLSDQRKTYDVRMNEKPLKEILQMCLKK